jgi:hypothetical protein
VTSGISRAGTPLGRQVRVGSKRKQKQKQEQAERVGCDRAELRAKGKPVWKHCAAAGACRLGVVFRQSLCGLIGALLSRCFPPPSPRSRAIRCCCCPTLGRSRLILRESRRSKLQCNAAWLRVRPSRSIAIRSPRALVLTPTHTTPLSNSASSDGTKPNRPWEFGFFVWCSGWP